MTLEEKILTILDEKKIKYDVMDSDLTKKNYVYFNPGVHDKSFKIKAWDLKKLCNPVFI